jgi:hypothetical protein
VPDSLLRQTSAIMYPNSLAFTSALTAVASLITLGAGLSLDGHHGLNLRSDEPCKQVRDQAAKWMSDNGIGRTTLKTNGRP